MPLVYRQRTSPAASSLEIADNLSPANDDNDDSIILSDLVRRGEASRLRRRGALRIDHNVLVQSSPQRVPTQGVRSAFTVGPPTWESSTELRSSSTSVPPRTLRYSRSNRRAAADSQEIMAYTLVCGGFDGDSLIQDDHHHTPFQPALLPRDPSSSSKTTLNLSSRNSNGCGALIHLGAVPRNKLNVWSAKGEAAPVVVPLEACYFDHISVGKIVKNGCGCIREGVGCAVWYVSLSSMTVGHCAFLLKSHFSGNPLGTRYKPCKIASDDIFSSRLKFSGPSCPEGPRYWHPSSNRSSSLSPDSGFVVYTFLTHAVTSYPGYEFPCPQSSQQQYHMSDLSTAPPFIPPTFTSDYNSEQPPQQILFSTTASPRYFTASPASLSDVGEDDQEVSQGPYSMPMVADFVMDEPSSPPPPPFDPNGDLTIPDDLTLQDKTPVATLTPER